MVFQYAKLYKLLTLIDDKNKKFFLKILNITAPRKNRFSFPYMKTLKGMIHINTSCFTLSKNDDSKNDKIIIFIVIIIITMTII